MQHTRNKPGIMFTHSYFMPFDPKEWKKGRPYPPLGTIQAAAVMREAGFEVSLYDVMFSRRPAEIRSTLDDIRPDYLVICDDSFNYLTKMCLTNMRKAAFEMAAIAKEMNIPVIMSGSDATDQYAEYLQNNIDYVILGETEATLNELIQCLECERSATSNNLYETPENQNRVKGSSEEAVADPKTLRDIPGIAMLVAGETVVTGSRPVMRNLDDLPLPAWDLVDFSPYIKMWKKHAGYISVNIATTRGCPFKCNWCAKPIYGNRYNVRSPEHVIRELLLLKTLIPFAHVWFCDDIFGLKSGWVQEFADLTEKHDLAFSFTMQGRADLIAKGDTAEALARAGCKSVWMGAESGSQKILDAMEKGQTIEHIQQATIKLRQNGISPAFFLQFGYPGENMEDIQLTFKMLYKLMPDDIGVSISYPLPGTKFFENVKNTMGNKANWSDSDELALMFRNNYSPKFYKHLHRFVHYYFRILQGTGFVKHRFSKAFTSPNIPAPRYPARYVVLLPWFLFRFLSEFLMLKRLRSDFSL